MKAVVNHGYCTPEELKLEEIPKPSPAKGEVLVRVHATTINRTDCGLRAGRPYFVRLIIGPFRPPWKVMGSEFAGIVEEVGEGVTEFKPGDEVFGLNQKKFGAHAEYMCTPASAAITHKPKNLSFEESVAIVEGPWLAMNIYHRFKLNNKHRILINGCSGSIGSSALQLAKHFGADVTAVINTKNLSLADKLGANRVINYEKEDFTTLQDQFDLVFDAVGKSTYAKCKRLLKPDGVYVSTELGPRFENLFLTIRGSITGKKNVIFPIPKETKEDIVFFKTLAEAGELKPVIDKVYTLEQVPGATAYVETGEKTGSVVIRVMEA
ncbi:MAG TPA: NAD(P)-dependent alcohol dehydrogenase [Chitinophagaceae bacterium]|nr:NAD(P)-dependent alcohol dehydrogenase [Chitinophagaceae bacterium]